MEWIITWIGQHPSAATWVVFAVAFLETFAFVGALVPGVVILFAIAAWGGNTQHIGLLPLILGAAAGSASANIISFYWGYRLKHRIEHVPLFVRHEHWLRNCQRFFDKWGPVSILIGRFIGPIRPFVAFAAGSLSLSPKRFILFDLLAVVVWAPAYIVPGYLTGIAVEDVMLTVYRWPPLRIFSMVAVISIAILIFGNYWLQARRPLAMQWAKRLHVDELPLASFLLVITLAVVFYSVKLPYPLDNAIILGFEQFVTPQAVQWGFAVWSLGHETLLELQVAMIILVLALMGHRDAVLFMATTAAIAFVGFYWLGNAIAHLSMANATAPVWHQVSIGTAQLTLIAGASTALLCEGVRPTQRWMLYLVGVVTVGAQLVATMALGFATLTSVMLGVYLGTATNGLLRIGYSFIRLKLMQLHSNQWPIGALLVLTTLSYMSVNIR